MLKIRLFILCLLVGIVLLSGCITQENSEVDFVYGEPTTIAAAPLIIAGEKGFWKEEGLNVKVTRFSAGRLAIDATINKSIQANSSAETPPMLAILNGHKIFIVATAGKHKETKFIGRKDKGIFEPKDLIGKKIASLPGTNSDYFLFAFLKANGLDSEDVQIVSMPPPEMISALIKGDIDGFFAWEPHIYYAKNVLKENAIVFYPGELYTGYHTIVMRQDFVKSNPKKVEQFLRGILRAEEFIENNPEESIKIVSKRLEMDEEVVSELFNEYDFYLTLEPELLEILNKESEWTSDTKITNSSEVVDFRDYIYTEILRKIKPSSVSIQ